MISANAKIHLAVGCMFRQSQTAILKEGDQKAIIIINAVLLILNYMQKISLTSSFGVWIYWLINTSDFC